MDINTILAELLAVSGAVSPEGMLGGSALTKWLLDTDTGYGVSGSRLDPHLQDPQI